MTVVNRSVGLVGARGHTGAELISLLGQHPGFELALASSRKHAGNSVAGQVPGFEGKLRFVDLPPEELSQYHLDALVLALPNGLAAGYVSAWERAGRSGVIVDLSADYRFDDAWTYGLTESGRDEIRQSRRIANPGCYATAMQLALLPLRDMLDGPPACFGVSGFSGAGTTPSPRNDPERLANNLMPYAPIGHIHEREVSRHLAQRVRFMPHVAGFFRGISMTISARLRTPHSRDSIEALYRAYWDKETLVHLGDDIPQVARNVGMHHACVGGWQLSDDGHDLVVFSTLDNLLTGAATQAMQNLNLACGFDELAGIPYT